MEAVRILGRHPQVEPWLLEHRQDAAERPSPRGVRGPERIPCTSEAAAQAGIEVVMLATPPEISMDLAPAMLADGVKVIDLSGAFRLQTVENYARWYKQEHQAPALLATAVYGLPEFHREKIRSASLVANPGCYPTAANLAIRPLVEAKLIDRSAPIVCDAKSGVSGAGRKPSLKTAFCEVTENFSAYSALDHRHVPEVLMNSDIGEEEFSFVAHLLPVDRGILESIYFRTTDGVKAGDILKEYETFYAGGPFVRTYPAGTFPDLRAVQFTNFCDIGVKLDKGSRRAVVVSVIDNLGKGAAGQAVQNLNLMLGLPESEGLL